MYSCGNSGYSSLATSIVCKEVEEEVYKLDAKLFPNPSNTEFTLQLTKLTSYAELIVKMCRRIVESRKLATDEFTISFGSQLPKGFYIAEIWTNLTMQSIKFIKL